MGRVAWLAVVLAVGVLLMWLAAAVRVTVAAHAVALQGEGAMLVVLRMDATDSQAVQVATEIGAKFPGTNASPVTSAEATNLLSLQESWMQSLPEVQLVSMPPMIELRTRGTEPVDWKALEETVKGNAAVDFVVANDDARERLTIFARTHTRLATALAHAMQVGAALLLLVAWVASAWRRRHRGALRGIITASIAAIGGVSAGIGLCIMAVGPWLVRLPAAPTDGVVQASATSLLAMPTLGDWIVPVAAMVAFTILLELFLVRLDAHSARKVE